MRTPYESSTESSRLDCRELRRTRETRDVVSLIVDLALGAKVEFDGDGGLALSPTSAVDTFSRAHDGHALPTSGWYRERMPAASPAPGQQFAFEVNLDACTGCKACVAACHSLNGLDDEELWRNVGLLHSVDSSIALAEQRTVTTACHHCVDPACLSGCPVDAYEKDELTGAVIHLDDQCIGCSYCTMTCPYEVPAYNDRLGIVRKCDMCRGRLVEGEAPACVQGCPNSAIHIAIVDSAAMRAAATNSSILKGAAPSRLTVPTTRFLTALPAHDVDTLMPSDHADVQPAPAHQPLAIMLVLTQVAAGLSVADSAQRLGGHPPGVAVSATALVIASVGLLASFMHLGRPSKAWRVVIGISHSWLSREALAFGGFASLLSVQVGVLVFARQSSAVPVISALTALVGLSAVAASAMVYGVTGRVWWSRSKVFARFGATTIICGAALAGAIADSRSLIMIALLLGPIAIASEILLVTRTSRHRAIERTKRLLKGQLRRITIARLTTLVVGVGLLTIGRSALVGAIVVIVSALLERSLFFRAVSPDRMPGWGR
jgi:formate dehydrogenase iron-sulfur subunit